MIAIVGIVIPTLVPAAWAKGKYNVYCLWPATPESGEILASIGQIHPNTRIEVDVTGMMSLTASGIATLRLAGDITNHSWMAKYSSKENNDGHPGPEILVYF